MKTITLFFAILFATSITLYAQNFPYNFSVSNEAYAPLTNPTSLSQGTAWDDPNFTLPLGYAYGMFGNTSTNLYLSDMFLGGFINTAVNGQGNVQAFMLTFADLIDGGYLGTQSLSEIAYEIEQTTNGKIFKLEYTDAGFYTEVSDLNTFNNKISAQVWFLENSNNIEVHFGPSTIVNPEIAFEGYNGPMMGFIENLSLNNGSFDRLWYLLGETTNPDINFIDLAGFDTLQTVLNGQPSEGLVYKFEAIMPSAINETAKSTTSTSLVYPTATTTVLNVVNVPQNAGFTITSLSGQVVEKQMNTPAIVDVSTLSPGAYFIRFEGETAPHKFVKQ